MDEISKYKSISKLDYDKISGSDWPSYEIFLYAEELPDFVINELEQMMSDITPVKTFIGKNIDYGEFLKKEYFYVVDNRSVLELGPNTGFHTNLIQQMNPKFHEAIEPNAQCSKFLQDRYFGNVQTIHDDAFMVLQNAKKIDVVICFGLLYHLHSPLYLLELIANNCDPDIILLDCVHSPAVLEFLEEATNTPGNRFSMGNWKSIKFNLNAPFEIVSQSMKQLDYKLIKSSNLTIQDNASKSNSWVGMWEKFNKEDN